MGLAEILTSMKKDPTGRVKFIFQPAEEGGAELMVRERVLKNPDVDVIFALHI